MKILARSVLDSFLTVFLLSFLVVSAVLTVGLLLPSVGYFLKGADLSYLLRLVVAGFHESLRLTVPISLFFSSVFVFGRLREDGELDAMRACGLRLWSVAAAPLVLTALLSGVFLYVNGELVPREHEFRRRLKVELFVTTGFRLFTPGETVSDLPKMRFRFDGFDGEAVRGLTVQDISDPQVARLLTAGRARFVPDAKTPQFELENMTLEPVDAAGCYWLRADRFSYRPRADSTMFRYRRRDKDMPTAELLRYIRDTKAEVVRLAAPPSPRDSRNPVYLDALRRLREHATSIATSARIEFARRIAYALSPFGFVLLGVALGARVRRAGLVRTAATALAVLLSYYVLILLAASLEGHPALHPEMIVCLTPVATLVAGLWLMRGL